jgi:hypothetical protein
MPAKTTLLLCAAVAAVDGWKAPPQKLLKPLATKLLEASLAVGTLSALPAVAAPPQQQHAPSRKYLFVTGFPFPLGPITERRTVQSELVKGRVYGFVQELRLSGITANSRCTVFRTANNDLIVYDPVAPTEEFLEQLASLNGRVAHILLGATTYEHKAFVGPFSRKFPAAKVWAVPDQWAWPLDLAPKALGIFADGDLVDTASSASTYPDDFREEFEVKLLRPSQRLGLGYAASEAALYHKPTHTLALTDAMINVPATPSEDYEVENLRGVGADAKTDKSLGQLVLALLRLTNFEGGRAIVDQYWASPTSDDSLQRGWERNVLLSLFFGPAPQSIVEPHDSFARLPGAWRVAPVTETLVYKSDRVRPELQRWVDDVGKWDFTYVAPAHFAAGKGSPSEWKKAFGPVLAGERDPAYTAGDLKLLETLSDVIQKAGVI